jgi:hypothetical protein
VAVLTADGDGVENREYVTFLDFPLDSDHEIGDGSFDDPMTIVSAKPTA